MPKKLLIFDFDGTIADTLVIAEQIMLELSPEFNLPAVSRQEIIHLKHKSIPELLKISGLSWRQVPQFVRKARLCFKKYIDQVKPITGMPDILHNLRGQGYRMGILTSNSLDSVNVFLNNHELQLFEFVYSPDSLFGKSRVIRRVMRKNRMEPQDMVMIGDEIRDVEAAHKAGVDSIAVTWGFNSAELLQAHSPVYMVHQPEELLHLLG
ncbi:MAG: HAD-IA family hydrolase [Bacteroidia bacterium]|nr:HAD-IA family hydrolase [Bacteroidia bacterium]